MIKLDEGLERIADCTYCTDYVGDVVNWLLNKPKPYRITTAGGAYDVWCIADAYYTDHDTMLDNIISSGWLQIEPEDYVNIPLEGKEPDYTNSYDIMNITYYGWRHGWFGNCMFIPNGDNFEDHGTDFYEVKIPIESGVLLFNMPVDFYGGGEHSCPFEALRQKLIAVGALPEEYRTVGGYFANSENY